MGQSRIQKRRGRCGCIENKASTVPLPVSPSSYTARPGLFRGECLKSVDSGRGIGQVTRHLPCEHDQRRESSSAGGARR